MEELDENFHSLLTNEEIFLHGGFAWFNEQKAILKKQSEKWEEENADD